MSENEELRTEWEFLRLTGSMSVETAGTERERIAARFLREHVKGVFKQAGVEFDRDAALLMVTMITSFDSMLKRIEETEGAESLAAEFRRMLADADNRPSLLFLPGLLMEDK